MDQIAALPTWTLGVVGVVAAFIVYRIARAVMRPRGGSNLGGGSSRGGAGVRPPKERL